MTEALTAGLKWGAIVGVLLYISEQLLGVISLVLRGGGSANVTDHPALLLPICATFFVILFACSAAGFYVGRETGRAGLGALAGVATLVVQYLLGRIYTVGAGVGGAAATGGAAPLNPAAQFFAALVAALLVLGLGAAMGWLGGRPGAQVHARRAAAEAAVIRELPPSKG